MAPFFYVQMLHLCLSVLTILNNQILLKNPQKDRKKGNILTVGFPAESSTVLYFAAPASNRAYRATLLTVHFDPPG